MNDEAMGNREGANDAGREGAGEQASAATGGEAGARADPAPELAAGEPEETPKLKLRRLKVHKWRNVLPGTELHFGDGIHAVLGKNGTGKTTLLKLISMCVRGNFEEVTQHQDEVDVEYDLDAGTATVHVRARNREPQLPPQLAGVHSLNVLAFDCEVAIDISCLGSFTVRSGPSGTEATSPRMGRTTISSPFRPGGFLVYASLLAFNGLRGTDRLISGTTTRALISAAGAGRLDEGLQYLRWLEDFTYSGDWGNTSSPHIRVYREPGNEPSATTHLIPAAVESSPSLKRSLDETRSLIFSSKATPFLATYCQKAGFDRAEMTVKFVEKRGRIQEEFLFGGIEWRFYPRDGGVIPVDLVSYGQGRFLAFLHYAACNPSILIADELTNGLHHEWIEACVDELEKRQSFVATQNPLLLDYLPIESPEQVQLAFIQCHLVEKDGKTRMSWRNTTEKEAEDFYKSYEVGIRHVSEILRAEGLW